MTSFTVITGTPALELHRQLCERRLGGRSELRPFSFFEEYIEEFFLPMDTEGNSRQHVNLNGHDSRFSYNMMKGVEASACAETDLYIIIPSMVEGANWYKQGIIILQDPHSFVAVYESGEFFLLTRDKFEDAFLRLPQILAFVESHCKK